MAKNMYDTGRLQNGDNPEKLMPGRVFRHRPRAMWVNNVVVVAECGEVSAAGN